MSVLFLAGVLPMADGQTLGEVLRAVQNRRQLQVDQGVVRVTLENQADGSGGSPVAGDLIDWGLGSSFPTDAQVNALAVGDQIKLLKHAWKESSYSNYDRLGGPVTLENFP